MIRKYLYFFDPKYSKMDQKNTNCTILIPKWIKKYTFVLFLKNGSKKVQVYFFNPLYSIIFHYDAIYIVLNTSII